MLNNFEHPWLLLLFLLILPLLIFRRPRYFLRHSYLSAISGAKKNSLLPFLKWAGWLLIVLAAIDYGIGYTESYKQLIIHNYVLINDGSGSMVVDFNPNGVGKKLTVLLKANDRFLKTLENLKRPDGGKDFVGVLVFSNDPFVVSHFAEDYDFIRQKLAKVDWRFSPLNGGTEMNKAIWAGVKLILKKNADSKGASFSTEELVSLETGFKGNSRDLKLKNLSSITGKLPIIKEQITGSSLIAFTDGKFTLDGSQIWMSIPKLLLFCKEMGIRFYLISVEDIDPVLLKYIKLTGGDGMIANNFNVEKINNAYQTIISWEAGEYKIIDRYQKKSYADQLAVAGLTLLLIYIVLRNTMSRSLTEI